MTDTVSFTFSLPWYQTANTVYYIYIVDMDQDYTYELSYPGAAGDPQLTSECMIDMCNATKYCGMRLLFNVNFDKINCCNPSCLNGSYCDNGLCNCGDGYTYNLGLCQGIKYT